MRRCFTSAIPATSVLIVCLLIHAPALAEDNTIAPIDARTFEGGQAHDLFQVEFAVVVEFEHREQGVLDQR